MNGNSDENLDEYVNIFKIQYQWLSEVQSIRNGITAVLL